MTLIRVTSGYENFEDRSMKSYLFTVPSRSFQFHPTSERSSGISNQVSERVQARDDTGEVMLWMVAKSGQHGLRRAGPATRIVAGSGMVEKMVGSWATQTFDIPDGVIIKVFSHKKADRRPSRNAAVYLRVRRTGPMQRLSAIGTMHQRAALPYIPSAEGRFDILSPDDLTAEGVVNFNRSMVDESYVTTDRLNIRAMFLLEILANETERPLTIQPLSTTVATSATGSTITVIRRQGPRRAIQV